MQPTGIDLLLKAIDVSLDRRKLALAVLGLVVAIVISGVFFGLAARVDDIAARALIVLLGLVALWIVTALFLGAISKMSYEDLAGRLPYDRGAALRYATDHMLSFLFAPLLLWVAVLAVYLVEALVLLLGRIPTAGPILSACCSCLWC